MKLRCGKQLSEETELLKNVYENKRARVMKMKRQKSRDINLSGRRTSHGGDSSTILSSHKAGVSCGPALKTASNSRSAKIVNERQKEKMSCDVISLIVSDTNLCSTVSGDSSVVRLSRKSVASCSPTSVRKHPQQTSASSVSLTNSSRKSNRTIASSEDLITNCRASLNTSSIRLERSSVSNTADLSNKSSSADSVKTSPSICSSVGSTAQGSRPLIVDVTNLRKGRARDRRETCSVVNSIIGEETEVEMVHEVNRLPISKIPAVKRKHRGSSVEVIARNVKAKITDSPKLHNKNDRHRVLEDDTCSVISLGSDEEVMVLDSTPIPRLDCTSTSDIIVLDTPPSIKKVPTSDAVTIDLCTPLTQSKKLRSPVVKTPPRTRSRRMERRMKRRKVERRNQQKFVKPTFKEYDSLLGNAHKRVGDLSSVRIQAPCQSTVPFAIVPTVSSAAAPARAFNSNSSSIVSHTTCGGMSHATAPSASFVSAQAVSSSRGGIWDHLVSNASSRLGNNQVDLVPPSSVYGSNLYNPNPLAVRMGLRPIVIDGSNVAMGHTNGRSFSCRGLKICIDYFLKRNHKVRAFVPQFRKSPRHSLDTRILDQLEKQGLVSFTPSRKIRDRFVVSYDDRYIVQYAAECGGVIVSTDNYRDLLQENPAWRETIEKRLLMFTWAEDVLIFPQDPLGRNGPNLEKFLRFP